MSRITRTRRSAEQWRELDIARLDQLREDVHIESSDGREGLLLRLSLDLPPGIPGPVPAYGLDPAALLRGFIADRCEIPDWADDPRPDGYTSHGSDERDLAWAWFERCGYGIRMEDERREQ